MASAQIRPVRIRTFSSSWICTFGASEAQVPAQVMVVLINSPPPLHVCWIKVAVTEDSPVCTVWIHSLKLTCFILATSSSRPRDSSSSPHPHPAFSLQKPASSALNHNNYPKNCTAEPVRGEGNEAQRHHRLPPLTITHPCAALQEGASAWDGAICSRHEDGENGPRCYRWSLEVFLGPHRFRQVLRTAHRNCGVNFSPWGYLISGQRPQDIP